MSDAVISSPPLAALPMLRWRAKLFGTWNSGALSLALIALLVYLGWHTLSWGLLNAEFSADVAACRQAAGACWGAVAEKGRLILLGRFPVGDGWRPVMAMVLLASSIALAALPRFFNRNGLLLVLTGLGSFVLLMRGGMLGLSLVTTDLWGGLPLTLFLAAVACLVGIPLGIVFAIGRRSTLPVVHWVSTAYIELIRAVPLITLLFFGAFVLPLVLPPRLQVDPMIRIAICLIAFEAAYIAEVVRGGMQAIQRGQYEAAHALGLGRLQSLRYVVLPQALRLTIAPTVNNVVGMLKNTSLVAVVNIYDMTGALKLALGDSAWKFYYVEMYLLVCAVYVFLGLAITRYGRFLERRYSLKR